MADVAVDAVTAFCAEYAVVAVVALPLKLPLNDEAETVPGNDVLPLPSNKVAVLAKLVNTPVYCLTYIGSLPSSAVANSAYPAFDAVPPTNILNWSLSAILPLTSSAELVPVTDATTFVAEATLLLASAVLSTLPNPILLLVTFTVFAEDPS